MDMIAERDDESRRLTTCAALIVSAPTKPTTEHGGDVSAIQDVILRLWRAQFAARRKTLSAQPNAGNDAERTQLVCDLNNLLLWETGEPIIRSQMG